MEPIAVITGQMAPLPRGPRPRHITHAHSRSLLMSGRRDGGEPGMTGPRCMKIRPYPTDPVVLEPLPPGRSRAEMAANIEAMTRSEEQRLRDVERRISRRRLERVMEGDE